MAAQPVYYPYNVVINHIKKQNVYGFLKNNIPVAQNTRAAEDTKAAEDAYNQNTPIDPTLKGLENINFISPFGQQILLSVESAEREALTKNLFEDNVTIDETYKDEFSDIEEYYPDEEDIGRKAEKIISIYCKCPICGEKSLKLFSNPNMPVVDLVCINPDHDIDKGPRLWQVKASRQDLYFNKTKSYITIGSKRWGYSIHQNFEDKNFLIGYICLKVEEKNDNFFHISNSNSFALYPNLEGNEPYYRYYKENEKTFFFKNKNVINWNNCIFIFH